MFLVPGSRLIVIRISRALAALIVTSDKNRWCRERNSALIELPRYRAGPPGFLDVLRAATPTTIASNQWRSEASGVPLLSHDIRLNVLSNSALQGSIACKLWLCVALKGSFYRLTRVTLDTLASFCFSQRIDPFRTRLLGYSLSIFV